MKRLLLISALAALTVASPPEVAAANTQRLELTIPDTCVGLTVNEHVMTIHAAPALSFASIGEVRADDSPLLDKLAPLMVLPFLFAGAVKTTAADKNSTQISDSVRAQLNQLVADVYYFFNTRPAWQVAAAAVAPPVCAIATTKSKVKTTATTEMMLAGVLKSLTATDNLWTLTGGNLAIGSVRRYMLLWDGASATTVPTVLASDDKVIASYASAAAALAACRFATRPALGTGIVGILSITNVTNAFIPATTLLDAAGVTAALIDGPDDSVLLSAQVTL